MEGVVHVRSVASRQANVVAAILLSPFLCMKDKESQTAHSRGQEPGSAAYGTGRPWNENTTNGNPSQDHMSAASHHINPIRLVIVGSNLCY
jgi:hypothetical protein